MLAVYVADVMGARDFGQWLTDRMEDMDMRQVDLERASGVSAGQINRYRNGQTRPDPATIAKLAIPLQADVDEMLAIAGHKEGVVDDTDTYVVRTDNPKVYRIVKMTEGKSPEEIERAIRLLRAAFDDEDDTKR